MKRWWSTLNTVDRLYFGWLAALTVAIVVQRARVPAWTGYLALHGGVLLIVALLARGAPRDRRANFFHDWYPLALFIVAFEEVARLSFLFVSQWQDAYLLRWEAALFAVPPTVWFAQHASPLLTELMNLGYFGYFVLLMIVGGAFYRWPDKRPFRQVMTASVLSYMICYVVFLTFPTEGPAHTLAAFHREPIDGGPFHWLVLLIQKCAGVHGNAFPSSHVAAGLVSLIFAWCYLPKLGAALTPVVILLCLGAVYDRYHYLLDVVGGLAVGAVAAIIVLVWKRQATIFDESLHTTGSEVEAAAVRQD
ncbi:MAG: phosphatase PAP2 family protein [Terriglobales bacterium]